MKSFRHLLLGTGRTLSLLAAVMLVLLSAIPGHAHMRDWHAGSIGAHHDHAYVDDAQLSFDADESDAPAKHAGDGGCVYHVSGMPPIAAVPAGPVVFQEVFWPGLREAARRPLFERLPEPPRPSV